MAIQTGSDRCQNEFELYHTIVVNEVEILDKETALAAATGISWAEAGDFEFCQGTQSAVTSSPGTGVVC